MTTTTSVSGTVSRTLGVAVTKRHAAASGPERCLCLVSV